MVQWTLMPKADPYAQAIVLTQEAMRVTDEDHYEEGERLLFKAMRLVPDEEIFTENYVQFCLQVAQNATENNDHDEAITYYQKAFGQRPGDAETLMDLGAAYARNNDPAEALGAWQKALALLNPKKPKDKHNIESILENVRLVEQAMRGR